MVAGEPLRRVGAPTPRLLRSPPLLRSLCAGVFSLSFVRNFQTRFDFLPAHTPGPTTYWTYRMTYGSCHLCAVRDNKAKAV